MNTFIIVLTTVIFHNLSNAWDTTTICNSNECKCNNNNISCKKLQQNQPFILPNDSITIDFVDVTITIFNNNTLFNGKLQSIKWETSRISHVEALYFYYLKHLDLSKNDIFKISDDAFSNCPQLEYIDLSGNKLSILSDNLFTNSHKLETIKLENNNLYSISEYLFKENYNLKNITIGNSNLSVIANNAMSNLNKLEFLSIQNSGIQSINKSSFGEHIYLKKIILNNSSQLKVIDQDFVSSIPNIEFIELNNCNIINLLPFTFVSLKNLKNLQMFETEIQPNCKNGWFSLWFNETTVIGYEKITYFIETIKKLNCPPKIYHTSGSVTLQLTKKGILDCMAFGNPLPAITWLVPGGLTFHENKEADKNISHHPNMHKWDLTETVSPSLITKKNGSLHILRMLRANVGNYTCYVSNKYGNDSETVKVHLDSSVFFNIKINALLLGITSALGFLILTILCCALKLLLIRLNCIKKRNQPAETEMGNTEEKTFPEDV